MTQHGPITDADLHAYVDGELAPDRRHAVAAWLVEHPADAARVADYQRLTTELRALHQIEPEVAALQGLAPGWRRHAYTRRAAVVAVWLSVGGMIGWFAHSGLQPRAPLTAQLSQHLLQPAAFAHRVYSPEIAHPVEVSADREQHLIAWLSKRLKTPVHAPNLGELGYRLIGGRLLPSTDRMAAQFMYQDARGLRITLYIRRGAWNNEETSFQYARDGSLGTFYWIDGPMGYALSGELSQEQLLAIAEAVYRQLNS